MVNHKIDYENEIEYPDSINYDEIKRLEQKIKLFEEQIEHPIHSRVNKIKAEIELLETTI